MNFMYNGKNILAIVRDLTDSGLAEVAMKIAESHPEVFAQALLGEAAIHEFTLCDGKTIRMTRTQLGVLESNSNKVVGIKALREWFGMGLREAKELSEDLARRGFVRHTNWIPLDGSNW
jgi:ribosomal protein L7/L12